MTLSDQVVASEPLGSAGASGNTLERVTLRDGRRLIRKRVSPEWDWLSRATGDDGRALWMWRNGLFDRIPAALEHATVAVEEDGAAWTVFMRDVSDAMVPGEQRVDRDAVQRVLAAMAEMHLAFWGERFPALCSLEQRYQLLSPETARREVELGYTTSDLIPRCWAMFRELADPDIARAIMTIVERPSLLAGQLDKCEPTLIHGDVRLSNLGFAGERVVLIDWGERSGTAPAAVDLASFLAFDARQMDVSRDDVISDFRELYGERHDERALQLALIGGMVQLAPHLVLEYVLKGGDDHRAAALGEIAWWTEKVQAAFETWSPV
ncbi:MAG: phosphotransferase [Mycobacteriales bacterium]